MENLPENKYACEFQRIIAETPNLRDDIRRDISRYTMTHINTVDRWIRGEITPPPIKRQIIAEVLGKDIEDVFPEFYLQEEAVHYLLQGNDEITLRSSQFIDILREKYRHLFAFGTNEPYRRIEILCQQIGYQYTEKVGRYRPEGQSETRTSRMITIRKPKP